MSLPRSFLEDSPLEGSDPMKMDAHGLTYFLSWLGSLVSTQCLEHHSPPWLLLLLPQLHLELSLVGEVEEYYFLHVPSSSLLYHKLACVFGKKEQM